MEYVYIKNTGHLARTIRRLLAGDCIHFESEHRLEYVKLDVGSAHYRLYHCDILLGIVMLRSLDYRAPVAVKLAEYIQRMGIPLDEAIAIEIEGALTPNDAPVHRQVHLFLYPPKYRVRTLNPSMRLNALISKIRRYRKTQMKARAKLRKQIVAHRRAKVKLMSSA